MAKKARRVIVVFEFKKYRKVGAFIMQTRYVVSMFKKNKDVFGKHKTKMTTVSNSIKNLDKAVAAGKDIARGSRANTEEKRQKVKNHLLDMIAFVQIMVRNEKDYNKVKILIQKSGLKEKVVGKKKARERLSATFISPGKYKLISHSFGKEAVNEWEQGPDDYHYVRLPATQDAETTVDNLESDTDQYFRHRANIDDKVGVWCKSIKVHVEKYER